MNFKKYVLFLIIFAIFNTFCVKSEEFYTQKDVYDAKTQAFALYNTSQKDEALEILNKIPKKSLTEEMYLVIANIYEDKKDYNNAYKNLNTAIQINPKSYKAYYNLGLLALKKNDNELAKTNFKKSIKFNRDFAYSYYNLGICYLNEKDYKSAKTNFIKAINLEPNKDFYYNLAYTYKQLGKEENAKKILEAYEKLK
ncbi:MAG: tetratricopeptide repeat protein [Cyanobacteria bacterium SIG30]|nr:tetratricopeptide repeat protein [Cyanobacteria bacterium SIG30]